MGEESRSFSVGESDFLLDGSPFRIIGGAMHYFRIHPQCWRDRLRKMRLMGINTLDTYVAWNLHEPSPGEFKFDGWLDIEEYIRIAGEEGLQVIVRPGPYICAEWEFGGQPAWLLKDPDMKLRCSYQPYVDATARFFKELLPRLASLQIHRGGPIIMVQLENEYGTYGDDKAYLRSMRAMLVEGGIEVPLFTCDWARDMELTNGSLDGVFMSINFDKNPKKKFEKLREYQKKGPLMVAEYWVGWFDQWGGKHAQKPAEDVITCLKEMLEAKASFTMYLFHGGTNFGFTSGANHYEEYQPTITSYDYDNPLSEAGDITPKFLAIRSLLSQYSSLPTAELPPSAPKLSIPSLLLRQSAPLLSPLSLSLLSPEPTHNPSPLPMELLDQSYGFLYYKTTVQAPTGALQLKITGMRDRAHVIVNNKLTGTCWTARG